ncbi:2-hydroxyacyl-CoA dehydratase family protein [bacterium]|nr:2-hydroxyacyl-CoA dehydratase family protein [bacterium]
MTHPGIQPFIRAYQERTQRLKSLKESGRKMIGYFCSYTPLEVIDAAGFVPVRVIGGAGRVEDAYSLVPDFICPFMKRCLEKAMAGEYRYLSGIVQGYTCDVACGIVNVWKENIPAEIYHTIPLPYLDSKESREYLRSELNVLIDRLNVMGGSCTSESLKNSINRYRKLREILADLTMGHNGRRAALSAVDRYYLRQACSCLPVEEALQALELLRYQISGTESIKPSGIPVMVSGSVIESHLVYEALEQCGADIVIDDVCSGERGFQNITGDVKNPLDAIIHQHFSRQPCPSRCRAEDRLLLMKKQIADHDIRGVIFVLQKFCTPHLADIPFLTEKLKALGIPSVVIEMDENWNVDGQFRTRIEVFLELIG